MQELSIPGFEGQRIEAKINNWGSSRLFVNGQPAPAGAKRGQYSLRRNDGAEVVAFFKPSFPDPVPLLMVGDQTVRLAEPLQWYQWAWAAFPLVLIFMGGAIGGLFGGGAAVLNTQIMRSNQNAVLKYVLSAIVTVVAFSIWLAIALAIHSARR